MQVGGRVTGVLHNMCVSVKFWTSLKMAAGLRSCKGFEVSLADCMFGNLSSFLLWLNALTVTLGTMFQKVSKC